MLQAGQGDATEPHEETPEGMLASSILPRPHPTRGGAQTTNGQRVYKEARGRNPRSPLPPERWKDLVPGVLRLQHTPSMHTSSPSLTPTVRLVPVSFRRKSVGRSGRFRPTDRAPTELYRKAVPVGLGAVSFGQAS